MGVMNWVKDQVAPSDYERNVRRHLREHLLVDDFSVSREQDNLLIRCADVARRARIHPNEAALKFGVLLYASFLKSGDQDDRSAAIQLYDALCLEIPVAAARREITSHVQEYLFEKLANVS